MILHMMANTNITLLFVMSCFLTIFVACQGTTTSHTTQTQAHNTTTQQTTPARHTRRTPLIPGMTSGIEIHQFILQGAPDDT